MAQFPSLPLWTDSYLADTTHLTTVEHGAYLLLLMAAWRSEGCRLPSDDKRLARFCKMNKGQWARVKDTVLEFWQEKDGFLYQGRLTDEMQFVISTSKKNSNNARARWLKTKDTGDATAMPDACQTDAPIPIPIPKERKEEESALKKVIENSDLTGPTKTLARQVVTHCFKNGGEAESIEQLIRDRIAGSNSEFEGTVNRMRGN